MAAGSDDFYPNQSATVMSWDKKSSEVGEVQLMVLYGVSFFNGSYRSTPHPSVAISWFQKSAEGRDVQGMVLYDSHPYLLLKFSSEESFISKTF